MLAGDLLRLPARRFPNKVAVIATDQTLTFAEVDAATNRFANALIAAGIEKGDRVAAMLPNIADYVAVHFGSARTGAILCHLSYRYAPKDLIYCLDKVGARMLIVHADFADIVRRFIADTPSIERIIVVGQGETDLDRATPFDAFTGGQPDTEPSVALSVDDPYSITFTGGTTGFPKAVVVSHLSRFASAVTIAHEQGLTHEDRAAVVTPLFHAAGLFVWFNPVIWIGCTTSLLNTWDPADFMAIVERDRLTTAFLVPTQLNGLLRHPAFDRDRLATLRNIGYAGSPMPGSLIAALREALPGVEFVENYGQSETGPMTIKRHWEYDDHPDSVGRPSFNVETDVFRPDGTRCDPDEVGEIVTRGAHRLVAYYDDPEQTAALFKGDDGWLYTGDVGFRDADGFITLVDRAKDMIISGAENIYPAEIEDVLFRHESVAECAVFGIPDDHWGEVPAAHVVLKAGHSLTADALLAHALEHLARYKRPRLIEFVDHIPKTPVGKIQKHLIRARYWQGREKSI